MFSFGLKTKFFQKRLQSVLRWAGSSVWLPAGKYIKQSAVELLQKQADAGDIDATDNESFQQVMKRYNLSDADLLQKRRRLASESLFYLVIGLGVFFYGCVMLMQRQWYVFFASCALTAMLFAFAFRAHFWLFQIKTKTLGCTWRDWWAFVSRGSKK